MSAKRPLRHGGTDSFRLSRIERRPALSKATWCRSDAKQPCIPPWHCRRPAPVEHPEQDACRDIVRPIESPVH